MGTSTEQQEELHERGATGGAEPGTEQQEPYEPTGGAAQARSNRRSRTSARSNRRIRTGTEQQEEPHGHWVGGASHVLFIFKSFVSILTCFVEFRRCSST